jgi:hypothetical protein
MLTEEDAMAPRLSIVETEAVRLGRAEAADGTSAAPAARKARRPVTFAVIGFICPQ